MHPYCDSAFVIMHSKNTHTQFFRQLNPLSVHNITISIQKCHIVIVYISRIFFMNKTLKSNKYWYLKIDNQQVHAICSEPFYSLLRLLYRHYLRDTYWNYTKKYQTNNLNGLFSFRLVKEKLHTYDSNFHSSYRKHIIPSIQLIGSEQIAVR